MNTLTKLGCVCLFTIGVAACNKSVISGDDYIGVWGATEQVKTNPEQVNTNFQIKDRIIIEKGNAENYKVSILARGVFTEMSFNSEKGYLCASTGACFELKDGKLLAGSNSGVKTYKKEDAK